MPQRVQISTNIDPFLKKRVDAFANETGRSLRKALEYLLRLGLDEEDRKQDRILAALERDWEERQKGSNSS